MEDAEQCGAEDLRSNNSYRLSNMLPGLQPTFPMVAPGLSGPRWKPPSTSDRQCNLSGAKKELANKQSWRVDEWKEHKQFSRALMRYVRTTDASLLQFHAFWSGKQPPDSNVYLSLYESRTIPARKTELHNSLQTQHTAGITVAHDRTRATHASVYDANT